MVAVALKKIGTSRDIVAVTYSGDTGFRTPVGVGQTWAEPGTRAITMQPGRYYLTGVPELTLYNTSPWGNEGNITLPTVVEFTQSKQLYCGQNGALAIFRL